MKPLHSAIAILLWACSVGPVPPGPVPDPPAPDPGGTLCRQAVARAEQLGCGFDPVAFEQACERFEELDRGGGAAGWNPECMRKAATCALLERCREDGGPSP